MKRYLLLLCAVSIVTAAERRPLVKFGLLDVGFGPTSHVLSGATPPVVLPFSCLEFAIGAKVGRHFGAAVGTAVIEGNLISDLSLLPVRAYLFYDFSPEQRWRKLAGFITATYVHRGQDGWNGSLFGPYLKLSGGASYTFYAVTPHAEIGYDGHWRFATLTAGVSIGGLHVFR